MSEKVWGGRRMEIENKLKEIINIILEKKEKEKLEKIDQNLSLRNDLEMDSLDLAELTVRIEDEFGVDVFEDGIVDTVQEVIEKIEKRLFNWICFFTGKRREKHINS